VLGRTPPGTSLRNCAGSLAATANFTLNNPSIIEPAYNADGSLRDVTIWGGGWGHNVG